MRSNVKIDIYGTVPTSRMLDDLIELAVEHSHNADWEDFIKESSEDAAVAMGQFLSTVVSGASPLSISIHDTSYCFEELRSSARVAGMGYRVLTSEGDSEYCYAYFFRPGWSEERQSAIVGEDSPLIEYKEIREAMSSGIKAVRQLVGAAESVLIPKESRIVIPDSVYLAWKASYDEEMSAGPGLSM